MRYIKKKHGYRRSIKEVIRLANKAGFEIEEIEYAGYAYELARSAILRRIPLLYRVFIQLDKWIHLMNCATVMNFKKVKTII